MGACLGMKLNDSMGMTICANLAKGGKFGMGDMSVDGYYKCPEDKGVCVARVARGGDGCLTWGVGMDCDSGTCSGKVALDNDFNLGLSKDYKFGDNLKMT